MWNLFRSLWRSLRPRATSSLRYKFKIPDPARPLSGEPPPWGPFYELVDFHPAPLAAEDVVGRTVREICPYAGTYGMGGPGFFGVRLDEQWLIIAIWGAASWIAVDGRIVQDMFWQKNGWPRPWMTDQGDELTPVIVGQSISSFEVAKHSLTLVIGQRTLTISESSDGRPILEGNKCARLFEKSDDLRRAVFLSPTAEVWV